MRNYRVQFLFTTLTLDQSHYAAGVALQSPAAELFVNDFSPRTNRILGFSTQGGENIRRRLIFLTLG